MGGSDTINSFEKKWCEWSVDETIGWFEFVLNSQNGDIMNEDDDYEIEDYSSGSDSSSNNENERDDEKHEAEVNEKVDFEHAKSCLFAMKFNAKKDLQVSVKSFQFERFGFKNKKDCKLLCKKTKELVEKYPRISKKSKAKNNKTNKQEQKDKNDYNLEGFVQDTNYD